MERIVLVVGAPERGFAVGLHGPDDVVVGEEVVESGRFDRETDLANGDRIAAQVSLRIHRPELHDALRRRASSMISSFPRRHHTVSFTASIFQLPLPSSTRWSS